MKYLGLKDEDDELLRGAIALSLEQEEDEEDEDEELLRRALDLSLAQGQEMLRMTMAMILAEERK